MGRIAIIICFICFYITSFAQVKEPQSDFWDRTFIGGSFGLAFGTYTFIDISPVLGYRITENFSVGAGPIYQYFRDKSYTPDYKTSVYGGSLMARQVFLENFFVQGEFQLLNLDALYINSNNEFDLQRTNVPILLIGGGYIQRFSGNSGLLLSLMYDVVGDINSPYPNDLLIRAGVVFGL